MYVTVCKNGPAGNYEFRAGQKFTFEPPIWNGTLLVSNPFVLAAGSCVDVYASPPPDVSAGADHVIAQEVNIPVGMALDRIVVQRAGSDCLTNPDYCPITITGQDWAAVDAFNGPQGGWIITFYNRGNQSPGLEGCTPGFWKNHPAAWPATGYNTTDDFDTVFGVNAFSPNLTLLAVLNQGGGGINALGRHAVAALLDAAHPDVDYGIATPAEVIQLVHDAIASGNESTIESMHLRLDRLNNAGCPINGK